MLKKNKTNDLNKEYLYYLMNDVGLLNDYDLHEIGITYDEYENPSEEVLDLIEDYKNKNRD